MRRSWPIASVGLLVALVAGSARADDEAPPRLRVFVADFRGEGVEPQTLRMVSEIAAVRLSADLTLEVISSEDVRRMLDAEAERQLLGCDDESSCLAEIGNALGAAYMLFGRVGRMGEAYVVSLTLLDVASSASVARARAESKSVQGLGPRVEGAVDGLAARLPGERNLAPIVVKDPRRPSPWPWVALGGAVLTAAGSGGAAAYSLWKNQRAHEESLFAQDAAHEFRQRPSFAALQEARAHHAEAERHGQAWDRWGRPVAAVGTALAAVSVLVVPAFLAWGLLDLSQAENE